MVRQRHSLGVGLLLAGLPSVWVVRGWLGAPQSQGFTIGLLLLGVLLVGRLPTAGRIRLYGQPFAVLLLNASILSLLTFSALAAPTIDAGPASLALVLAVSLTMFTVPRNRFENIDLNLTVVGLASCSLVLIPVLAGEVSLGGARLPAGSTASTNQVAFAGGIAVTMGVYCLWRRSYEVPTRILAGVAVLVGLAVIVLSQTRTVVFGLLLCTGLAVVRAFWKRRSRLFARRKHPVPQRLQRSSLAVVGLILVTGVFLLSGNRSIKSYAFGFADSMERGYQSLVFGNETEDISAGERRRDLKEVWSRSTVTGRGYRTLRVDAPLAQALYDMGILGGGGFAFITLLVPLLFVAHVALKPEPSHAELCGIYLYVVLLPNLFFHGTPYDFTEWLPVVVLFGLTARRSRPVSVQNSDAGSYRVAGLPEGHDDVGHPGPR